MAQKKNADAINRLREALDYYDARATRPERSKRVIEEIRYRFNIGPKTMHTALLMRAGGINATTTE